MVNVLFVCLGNICRSPMAEAVFRHKVKERNLEEKIQTDSCGTAGYHIGDRPHKGTRGILDKYNISYEGMLGRKLEKADLNTFDYIVAMDSSNLEDIQYALGKSSKIRLFSSFIENPSFTDVPDPWYTGDFDETYKLVSEGTEAILDEVMKNLN